MEYLGSACSGKLFWIWGLYAGVVAVLTQLAAAANLPPILAWLMAGGLAAAALVATDQV
jgi:hypothetical protein